MSSSDSIKAVAIDFELLQHQTIVDFPPPQYIEIEYGRVPGVSTVRVSKYKLRGVHRAFPRIGGETDPNRDVAVYDQEGWYDREPTEKSRDRN